MKKIINFYLNNEILIKSILFYFTLILLCFAFGLSFNTLDVDLWSRLMMGKHVIQQGGPLMQDFTSFTQTHTWFDHEWISSAIIYLVVDKFGGFGLEVFKVIFSFFSIVMIDLAIAVRRKQFMYKYKIVYILGVTAIFNVFLYFALMRCERFSMFFLPLMILLLELVRRNPKSKVIYFIPLLMLVWANCHAATIAAVGMIGFYALGEFISMKPFKHFVFLVIACGLVHLINPWGFEFIKFLYGAMFIDRSYIDEWLPLYKFDMKIFYQYLWVSLFVFGTFVYSTIRTKTKFLNLDFTKIIMYLILWILALFCLKHLMLFLIIASIFCYDDFAILFNDLENLLKKIHIKFPLWIFILVGVLSYSIYILKTTPIKENWWGTTVDMYPVHELQFIIDNKIKGNMYAIYSDSQFIAYKLYPNVKIFTDGRQEQVFDESMIKISVDAFLAGDYSAFEYIKNAGADIFLIPNDLIMNDYLIADSGFEFLYSGEKYSLFVKKEKVENKQYIVNASLADFNIDTLFNTRIDFSQKGIYHK